jgi:hypothetical protein
MGPGSAAHREACAPGGASAAPAFDGVLPLADLATAVAEARTAVMPDPRQVALKRTIAEIRARVLGAGANAAAG